MKLLHRHRGQSAGRVISCVETGVDFSRKAGLGQLLVHNDVNGSVMARLPWQRL